MAVPPTPANAAQGANGQNGAAAGGGWVYSQTTGELTHNGAHVATGYSGAGPGRNNPALQSSQGQGPIPQGRYDVGAAHQGTQMANSPDRTLTVVP